MRSFFHYLTSFLKKPGLMFCVSILALAGNAQTYNSQYTDGQVYFKLKDNIQTGIKVNADRSVNLDQPAASFLENIRKTYSITGMERPFDLNNDSKLLRTYRLDFSDPSEIEEIMETLRRNPDMEYAERVPYNRIEYVPNDTLYNIKNFSANLKWHLDRIQAEQAWDITKGSPAIKVAIVDNAIWADHPDLKDKIVLQHDSYYNTSSSNPPGTGDPFAWSHGTHCSGLVAGESDNTIGIASVGYNTSIIAIKSAKNTEPDGIYGYAGIQYAANNGADVISMSWGGSGYASTDQNIINTIYNMGIVLVGAAGNDNVSTAHYPSAYNHVISVASTNADDLKSDFSNYGTTVDVSAPGGYGVSGQYGLLSSTYSSGTYGNYDLMAGTSMATPMVSGLCGLILSMNPNLNPDQLEAILKSTSDTIDYLNPGYTGKLGTGRINAYKAVSNTPFTPVANFTTPLETILPGTSINFTDLSKGIPSSWSWTFSGGSPASSIQQNPTGITYNSEGVYNVTLVCTNSFGTNTILRTGYITVTSTPKPVVDFSSSDSLACIGESILFSDSSIYSPISWEWSFNPDGVSYMEGTSGASQNPIVSFSTPGNYSVSLRATNVNGNTLNIKNNFLHILGGNLPIVESFETGASTSLVLADTIKSSASIDARSANGSLFGLHFQGSSLPTGWSGGTTTTTHEQAWNDNKAFHSEATICGVNGLGMQNLIMQLDLKQTYSLGPKQCWFRVLLNGDQISDLNGMSDFNPTTAAADIFTTKVFDLSAYAGSIFSLTLQACTRFEDKKQGEGDNVMVDNIRITNTTDLPQILFADGFGIYPNPSTGLIIMQLPSLRSTAEVRIVSAQGQTIYRSSVSQDNTMQLQADLSSAPRGIYLVILRSDDKLITRKLILR
jgi:PKD repeat protein